MTPPQSLTLLRLIPATSMPPLLLALIPALPLTASPTPAIHPEYNAALAAQVPLEEGWRNPPRLARTRAWWWWLNGRTTKAAITRDLTEMQAKGLGGANIIDAGGDDQRGNQRVPHGPDFASPAWLELFTHALAEADRLGLELGFNITSGWNLGGPMITPDQAAKQLTFSTATTAGGRPVVLDLPTPQHRDNYYRDIAVLAVPRSAGSNKTTAAADSARPGHAAASPANEAGKILHFEQKAYYKYPGQFTATEAWHLLDIGPADTGAACAPEAVRDVSASMDAAGRLVWDAPAGDWELIRLGYTCSGAHVSTHSEGWGGRAIDYLDRESFQSYWHQVMDPILTDARPWLGKSLRFLHTDSWELGPVNWTKRMPAGFRRLRGYEMTPYLPVLAGRIIGSREVSTRFLNDFRRTLADLMAENKYLEFSQHAHAVGCGIHPESGGPHAGPMDALRNLGISDVPMGEFWAPSPTHRVHDHQRFFVKQTSSAAHVYGRRVSLAEAFTTIGTHWQESPRSLKLTFDRAACEGHNLTMWHTFDCSPAEDGLPGSAYFAGSHFNPNLTWWRQAPAFTGYLNRCHFLLQQGLAVADVLHFYGENIPAFVRLKRDDPAQCLPGYDYDVIDLEALLTRTRTNPDGRIVLPDGTSYRLLSLTPHDAISLPALHHVARLVEAGATLVGPRPARQYSLSGTPPSDAAFAALCDRLWGAAPAATGEATIGEGRVVWGKPTRDVLRAGGTSPDFTWLDGDDDTFIDYIHRRTDDTEIYFVANRNPRPEKPELSFRITGRIPEMWDPVTGNRRDLTRFRERDGHTLVPLPLEPEQACFIVFRKPAGGRSADDGAPNVPDLAPAPELTGPWQVAFDPAWGGPASITFDRLVDWTSHPDDGIRHYSGTATYRKTFDGPGNASNESWWLDLGTVHALAEVTLNGRPLGVVWARPPRVEVSGSLRPGPNHLEVKVVNLWANRLIGDAGLPPASRRTRTNITHFKPNTPLEPSGLLGPVRLLHAAP